MPQVTHNIVFFLQGFGADLYTRRLFAAGVRRRLCRLDLFPIFAQDRELRF